MKESTFWRFIQVSCGILLIGISAAYLWRNTLLPILKAKLNLEEVSHAAQIEAQYSSRMSRADEARARALESERERRGSEGSGETGGTGRTP